jgi:hypothetical protein
MGVIQEFFDIGSKLNFVAIILHEYEQGLFLSKGVVLE